MKYVLAGPDRVLPDTERRSSIMATSQWTLPEQFDEYRLVRMLGRGSMGVVFLGHDLVLDRPVAIKFLNAVNANTRARERFLTEARAAARIQHPNVMGIYRVGELEGRLYIIGEYIRGESLSELTRPMPWQEVLKLAVGLARGLACAHRQGVLHRDIKLANAMRSEAGEVKLLDFSLAKLLEGAPVVGPSRGAQARTTLSDESDDPNATGHMRVIIGPGERGGRDVDSTLAATPKSGPTPAAAPATVGLDSMVQARPERMNDSSDATVVGTPYYMAPELWRSQPASRGSDVYALGVLLYILCHGAPPIEGSTTLELARRSQEVTPKPLRSVAPAVDGRFAEIVDRCLRAPADRYPSADELCSALETLALGAGPAEVVRGNPYRGLQAFEARHRGVFFGRGAEIRAVVDRLRAEPFVLVAGDSGVGKSSLCRAGVLPVFTEQAINRRTWTTISLMPGRRPLQTLVSALASTLAMQEEPLRDLLESEPGELLRMIARRQGKEAGLILFIDQLEELVTLADRHQLQAVGRFLAELASNVPGIRLLATVRGDFLTRVAALPHVGLYINAAIHLLTPLSREGVREAIVGPARLQDVDFDSEALIDELVTAGAEGSLPLMQFALAELWEARDTATRQITMHDLERIGRVTGALARHADNVVDALPAAQRVAVRRLLMRLVTIEDTRASLPREDLVVGDQPQEAALEALVRGRLVVAREAPDGTVYEIAHEALIRSWGTLQRWTSEEREVRQICHRLEIAALEWQRLGSTDIGLWSADQLAEGALVEPDSLRPRELAFLAAGTAHVRRQRRFKLIALITVPVVLLFVFVGLRVQQASELAGRVDQQLVEAHATLVEARASQAMADQQRARAFAEFDAPRLLEAERLWTAAQAAAVAADQQFRRAIQGFEAVLQLDAGHLNGRRRLAEALLERALAAESGGRHEIASELIERLALPIDSDQLARWHAPGVVSLRSRPAAPAVLARYVRDPGGERRVLGEPESLGEAPVSGRELAQGSYRLSFRLADGQEVHYPFVVGRAERLELDIALPAPEAIPAGYIHIPAGGFLFGTNQEILRDFFITVPQHPARTGAYLIARHETTYADWIAYLEALPPADRERLLASNRRSLQGSVIALERSREGAWSIAVTAGEGVFRAALGELLTYGGRPGDRGQDWLRMPVTTINWPEAADYAAWLAGTGRVPGARLCDEWEWERAARGADGRRYPHGDSLAPTDSNINATYGELLEASGPDVVGSHPESHSPFGLEDAAGNAFEWTLSRLDPGTPLVRGGSFAYEQFASQSVNRLPVSPKLYDSSIGLRLCATPVTGAK